jgi:hypothetical protein
MLMKVIGAVTALLLLAGCATQGTPRPPAAGEPFTGEVWTWDQRQSIVTLRQGDQTVRVKVTPDQMAGLRLHQTTTIRGELAPPAELNLVVPAEPMTAVPRGATDENELTGAVSMVDSVGRLSINSSRGPVHVWGAAGVEQRYRPGQNVRVKMAVQAVDMVPTRTRPASVPEDPAAKPGSEPGDYATVTGRVVGVNPGGAIVVESPTGPIQVYVGDSGRYRVADTVQVRTSVHPVE